VAKDRQAYAVMALLPFWTGKTCADINDKTCDKYVEHRAKQNRKTSTARRELGVLRAAVVRAHANGIIEAAPSVSLPPMGEPSPGWLSRSELARLLWDLRRRKETRHAARFVICMFYSGSRPGTVIKTTWKQRKDGPWVDLRNKIWWRAGAEEQKTKKSRRRHRIPISLMSHLNRWRRIMMEEVQAGRSAGQTYVIEDPNHPGKPASDLRIILTEACERLNITRITPHGLKHTAITNAIKSGMSLTVAADYFSTSVQTIERVYWHQSPYHQQEAAAMMDWAGKPPSSGPSRRNGTQ
jgi:integrase